MTHILLSRHSGDTFSALMVVPCGAPGICTEAGQPRARLALPPHFGEYGVPASATRWRRQAHWA